jgi:hypothetical protein
MHSMISSREGRWGGGGGGGGWPGAGVGAVARHHGLHDVVERGAAPIPAAAHAVIFST